MAKLTVQSLKEIMTTRRYVRVAAVVVFSLLIVGLFYCPWFGAYQVHAPEKSDQPLEVKGPLMDESLPVHLKIPSANIDADFSAPLGLAAGGEIEVPTDYESVAYYKNGPTPGEAGPAVVLGHVDSVDGPAAFFSLGQTKVGDEILVERADGTVATFAITELERNKQSSFPTVKVYGDVDHAGLRLITCTGVYDHDQLRYSHNLIVYAKLVSTSTVKKQE